MFLSQDFLSYNIVFYHLLSEKLVFQELLFDELLVGNFGGLVGLEQGVGGDGVGLGFFWGSR